MNADSIIECVPNFSEGMDAEKVRAIVASMNVEGVRLLDWSRDEAHNRSVVTIAGAPEAVVEAAVRSVGKAAQLIDLTRQSGVHPRIGAADVVPFVPVSGISLAECAMLARQAGLQIWRRFGVPVYFYGAAAARPDRVQLEDVRRGQFEGLREATLKDAMRRPDVGGPELHAQAGASAVGARSFLIAYNLYIGRPDGSGLGTDMASGAAVAAGDAVRGAASEGGLAVGRRLRGKRDQAVRTLDGGMLPLQPDIAAARAIARDIRASSGGMNGVKALGLIANGRAQISMNITDYRVTPMRQVYAAAKELAARHGVEITEGELIGLIPEAAYEPDSDWVRQTKEFDPAAKVLDRRLHQPLAWP